MSSITASFVTEADKSHIELVAKADSTSIVVKFGSWTDVRRLASVLDTLATELREATATQDAPEEPSERRLR